MSAVHPPSSRHTSLALVASLGDHPPLLRMPRVPLPGCLLLPTKMGSALTADRPGTALSQPECATVPCAGLRTGARQAQPAAHHGTHRNRNRAPQLELPTLLVGIAWQQSVRRRTCERIWCVSYFQAALYTVVNYHLLGKCARADGEFNHFSAFSLTRADLSASA